MSAHDHAGPRLLAPDAAGLRAAIASLRAGEPIGLPTETVYGLAAPVFDEAALRRVFEIKGRPTTDPLIVHVPPPEGSAIAALEAAGVVDPAPLSPAARDLVEALCRAFWPGPLTLVLPKAAGVPALVTSGLSTVAIRAPRHAVAIALLRAAAVPLCAPSANRFGHVSPTTAEAVVEELGDGVGVVLDGGPCEVGVESTVARVAPSGARLEVLRPGGVSVEALSIVAGDDVVVEVVATGGGALPSPGLCESHYAPRKPLWRLEREFRSLDAESIASIEARLDAMRPGATCALLCAEGDAPSWSRLVDVRVLSPEGHDEQAARHLFSALRALDAGPADVLLAEPCPSRTGLWLAIDDRLRRASVARVGSAA